MSEFLNEDLKNKNDIEIKGFDFEIIVEKWLLSSMNNNEIDVWNKKVKIVDIV